MVNALQGSDIVALARDFGSLDKKRPDTLLTQSEWVAGRPRHSGVWGARLQLARTYADAISESFLGPVATNELGRDTPRPLLSIAEARALTGTLLRRAGAVSALVLEVTLRFTLGALVDRPTAAFKERPDDPQRLKTAVDTPAGELWKYLSEWSGQGTGAQAAFRRTIRECWLVLDQAYWPKGPRVARAGPLLLGAHLGPTNFMEPAVEASAILSACWTERPLTTLEGTDPDGSLRSIEGRLDELAKGIQAEDLARMTERYFVNAQNEALASPEELLLRANPGLVPQFARELAERQGPHDGRAYRLLMDIERTPNDANARRSYARMTVVAPWRLVREDPAVMRTWSARPRLGATSYPSDLDELREMLSEPPALLPEGNLIKSLDDRMGEGGPWNGRKDLGTLLDTACNVPGQLPWFAAVRWVHAPKDPYEREVAAALSRLDTPDEHPAGLLARDVFFLRAGAARRPHVRLPGGEIDLREHLPARFVSALRNLVTPPAAGTRDSLGTPRPSYSGCAAPLCGSCCTESPSRCGTGCG